MGRLSESIAQQTVYALSFMSQVLTITVVMSVVVSLIPKGARKAKTARKKVEKKEKKKPVEVRPKSGDEAVKEILSTNGLVCVVSECGYCGVALMMLSENGITPDKIVDVRDVKRGLDKLVKLGIKGAPSIAIVRDGKLEYVYLFTGKLKEDMKEVEKLASKIATH